MGSSYSISDVIWAINIIDKFTSAKKRLEDFMKSLATKGVKISERDLSNPSAILPAIMQAKRMGVDFDMDELQDILTELGDVSFGDVKKALQILRTFHSLDREVDSTMRTIMGGGTMTLEEFSALAKMFGFDIGINIHGDEYYRRPRETSVEEYVSPEELEKLKSFLKQVKSSE
jgi:lipoate synthase